MDQGLTPWAQRGYMHPPPPEGLHAPPPEGLHAPPLPEGLHGVTCTLLPDPAWTYSVGPEGYLHAPPPPQRGYMHPPPPPRGYMYPPPPRGLHAHTPRGVTCPPPEGLHAPPPQRGYMHPPPPRGVTCTLLPDPAWTYSVGPEGYMHPLPPPGSCMSGIICSGNISDQENEDVNAYR